MILPLTDRQSNCTARTRWLKLAILLSLTPGPSLGATRQEHTGDPNLRRELTRLVESGQTDRAVARVQEALRQAPDDAGVRREYVALHLALARSWLAQRRFDDCLTAVGAILAIQPDHAPARAIREQVLEARKKAANQTPEIDRLLRLELFETALERIREVNTLRPDLAEPLAGRERAAWLGAADDHYLARNFNEAFALYEHLISLGLDPPPEVSLRWLISLALGLFEHNLRSPIDPDVALRMLTRLTELQPRSEKAIVGPVIGGLLAEGAGQYLDAGRKYAQALGVQWQLPPADQRRATAARLRQQAIQRIRGLHDADRGRRRDGAWRIVLPAVWKHRQSEHFDVFARNDLVAERIAEAAEFHFAGLSSWLNMAPDRGWEPRCELRIHATLEDLHQSTDAQGITRAVTKTRVQGARVLQRQMNLYQADPWLFGSTLPHELTHLLLADAQRSGELPLAIDEGLAVQAEPPARRLQFRRLLGSAAPAPGALLAMSRLPADQPTFYARCDALTSLLLHQAGLMTADDADRPPIATVLRTFREGYTAQWWKTLGWESEPAMLRAWAAWHAGRRDPPRMPLMILAEPSRPGEGDGD